MRIAVALVIEMTDEQVKGYADEYGLDDTRAKTIVQDARTHVLTGVQGIFDGFANVTIKR